MPKSLIDIPLSSLASVLGDGVYVLDAEGQLVFLNQEGERLLGWSEKELLGMNAHEVFHWLCHR